MEMLIMGVFNSMYLKPTKKRDRRKYY